MRPQSSEERLRGRGPCSASEASVSDERVHQGELGDAASCRPPEGQAEVSAKSRGTQ
jgi:hypothetical protein